ncbi:MAG: GFA family protein [Steroidobacteraceae bacterium]
MKYSGSCHCGAVAFDVEGTLESALACNCSLCGRKGSLLWFVPRSAFRLTTREDASEVYEFNQHVIQHRFCKTCGIHPYAEGVSPDGPMAAVNVRCLEGVDLASVPVTHYDGRTK